jgi:hypothetical protein
MTFWWFKEKHIPKKLQITASYHKISTLCGITFGDGSLGLELSLPCYTVVKSGVVRMEWSQETIIQFIDEIKKRPIIWDPKHPLHFNKVRKQDVWEELATEMKRPVDECKKKMESLMSALRWEKRKMKKSSGTGKGKYL